MVHWDPGLLGRKLSAGGFGLLVVEGDTVFEGRFQSLDRKSPAVQLTRDISRRLTNGILNRL